MEIKVFLTRKADKLVFCRIIDYNDSIKLDFLKMVEVFKILFGSDCVVCFNVFHMIGDNNVFNIRYNKRNKWLGQTGQKHGFCCFDSRDHAVRACFKLLVYYIRSGHDTYRKIINRFAPPSENDTKHYLEFVCDNPFIDPDHEVVTYDDLLKLMAKMAMMENGIKTNHIYLARILQVYETNFDIYSRIKM